MKEKIFQNFRMIRKNIRKNNSIFQKFVKTNVIEFFMQTPKASVSCWHLAVSI